MRRYVVTFVALLLCLLLFLYARTLDHSKDESSEKPIFELDTKEVNFFEIREGEKEVRLENDPANEKIQEFLEGWSRPSARPLTFEEGPDWKVLGLDPPEKRLLLRLKGGESKELLFGRKNPVGWDVYLRIGGSDQVYLIPRYLAAGVTATPSQFQSESPDEADPDPSSPETDAR